MRYNTGNPVEPNGSSSPLDLHDNAGNLDLHVNGDAPTWPDRLGRPQKSLAGMRTEFQSDQASREAEFELSQQERENLFDDAQEDRSARFDQFIESSGYQVIGDYASQPVVFGERNELMLKDGELWRPKASVALPYTTTGDWVTEGSNFVSVGDAALRQELAGADGAGLVGFSQLGSDGFQRPLQSRQQDWVSLADFCSFNDGISLCDDAGAKAELLGIPIYVPKGMWRFSTPMIHDYRAQFFGPGVLQYDNAEAWRKGGSSGSESLPENYTLTFDFDSQSDVSITFDGVPQALTWIDTRTVQAPGSTTSTSVKINIANGRVQLTMTPESIRSFNSFSGAGSGTKVMPTLPDPLTNPAGMNNVALGPRNLMDLTTGGNNTAGGSRALMSVTSGENNSAFGFQTLWRAKGTGNSAFGSIAGEHLTSGNNNTLMGLAAGGGITTGSNNVGIGFEALNESKYTNHAVAVGYRALGNGGDGDTSQCVAIGAFSQDFGRGLSNTSVGYRALNGDGGVLSGNDNTAQGAFAARHLRGGSFTTVFGSLALEAETSVGELFAMGYQSLRANLGGVRNTGVGTYSLTANVAGNDNTAVGWSGQKFSTGSNNTSVGSRTQELATTGSNNSTHGFEAGRNLTTGSANTLMGTRAGREVGAMSDNTAQGSDALQFVTSGGTNSAFGRSALRLMQDGSNATAMTNCTGIGANSRVSGSNQVQIGDSATTVHVYGTVQNRSDIRDKTDVRATSLGLEFVNGLRAVEGRWDMREDYYEDVEVVTETSVMYDTGLLDDLGYPITSVRVERAVEVERRSLEKDGTRTRDRFHQWFIAQEVQALCERMGVEFGGYQDHSVKGGCDVMSLGYDEFIPPIVKAIQELNSKLDGLKSRLLDLES